jgi:hypothetical protein
MNEAAVKQKIDELCEALVDLPTAKTPPKAGQQTSDMTAYALRTSAGTQAPEDLLDQLRLQIKYVVFDLEATRRENRYLRQMIDNRRPPESEGNDF